jgi:branched-chain amino acid transport system ATP-binding protein
MTVPNILNCENITVKFGGVIANNNVSLHVEEGKVIGLIGPNGAGKTTLFNVLSKFQQHDTGHVYINDKLIDSKGPSDIVGLGMARTFQNINLFSELTTLDNILLGAHRLTGNPIANMYSFKSARKRERNLVERAGEIADMLGISDELDTVVKQLPYGIQKRVEIARALAADPKLILLDEPVAGCNDEETAELREVIRKVNRDLSITILMVEHDMSLVMSVCDYIFVLNFGSNLAEGTPAQIRTNPEVIKAYLGQEEET